MKKVTVHELLAHHAGKLRGMSAQKSSQIY